MSLTKVLAMSAASKEYVDDVAANYDATDYVTVADEAARLALSSSSKFVICIQIDTKEKYYLEENADPSVAANWEYAGSVAATIEKDADGTANYLAKWDGANTIKNSGIYEAAGNVGIGTTDPENKWHIKYGDSGGTSRVSAGATIENDGSIYLQFLTPNTFASGILFGDPEADNAGYVVYNHEHNQMKFAINGTTRTTIESDGTLVQNGYTKLGSEAPATRKKEITGTTPAVGISSVYSTGISKNKIVSFTIQVSDSNGRWVLPNHGIQSVATEYYFALILPSGELSIYVPTESTAVHTCAFTCLIEYKE